MDHVVIYTGRVAVRLATVTERYLPDMVRLMNDPASVEGTLQRPPFYVEEEEQWLRELPKQKDQAVFAVLVPGTDQNELTFVGTMSINKIRWPNGTGVTGSLLGPAENLSRGYGTEAKLLLMEYAFEALNLRKLHSAVKAFNGRSLGHLLKCGYRVIGTRTGEFPYRGRFVDEILLEAHRADWEPVRDAYEATGTLPTLTDEQRAFVAGTVSNATGIPAAGQASA